MNELKGKPTNQNPSPYQTSQPKKPLGPDTLFFEAMKGKVIQCVGANEDTVIIGRLQDYDRYGMVLDTDVERSEWKHGLVYVFKASLAWFHPVDDK
jgi:hypothetical protein